MLESISAKLHALAWCMDDTKTTSYLNQSFIVHRFCPRSYSEHSRSGLAGKPSAADSSRTAQTIDSIVQSGENI